VVTVAGTYNGDSNFNGSSGTTTQTVNKASSKTVVSGTPNPSVFGQAVTVTATVTAVAPGAGTPTGTVSVSDGLGGSTDSCTVTLSAGTGNCQITPSKSGISTVTGTYSGDVHFNLSSGTTSQTVNKAPIFTSLAQATFQANVAGSFTVTTETDTFPTAKLTSTALPTGVSFTDNGNGTGTLSGTPAASDEAGTYSVTYTASNVAGTVNQPFTVTIKNFLVSLSTASATVAQGQNATTSLKATSVEGYAQNLTPSCGVSPAGPACSFNPATIAGGQGTAVDTISNASNTTPAVYTVTVSATDANNLAHSTAFTLDVCQFAVGQVTQTGKSTYQFPVSVTTPFTGATSCQWTASGFGGAKVTAGGSGNSNGTVTFTATSTGSVNVTFNGSQAPFVVGSVPFNLVQLTNGVSAGQGGPTNTIPLQFTGSPTQAGTYNLTCPAVSGTELTTDQTVGPENPLNLGMSCHFGSSGGPGSINLTIPSSGTATTNLTIVTTASTSSTTSAAVKPVRGREGLSPLYALLLGLPGIVWLGTSAGGARKKSTRSIMLRCMSLLVVAGLVTLLPSCGGGFTASFTTPTTGTPAGTYAMTVVATNTNTNSAHAQYTFSVPFIVSAPH
jgi:large repetitive protein